MHQRLGTAALIATAVLLAACGDDGPTGTGGPEHLLVDIDGRVWDISYALDELGLDRDGFGHGIGVDAIPPITDPAVVHPGDPGYPVDGSAFTLLGVAVDDSARAYRLATLVRHEVVNDHLGGVALAATY